MDSRIVQIEWARLTGERPRKAGCNARLGEHGKQVHPPIARVTTEDGASGFGWSRVSKEDAERLVGTRLSEAFLPSKGVTQECWLLEYPLWDLVGKVAQEPVYALVGGQTAAVENYQVPCYDTSIYMDDLHLSDHAEAATFMAEEALQGAQRGHTAFKIKVGRGAMHMDLEAGTRRDIAVIHAIREAVGADATILLDANNGYNLNLTKHVLGETADVGIYWMEEAFHEDPRLYTELKRWLDQEGLSTRIADGEGEASARLLDWARDGLIDVVQYDIHHPGFTRWCELGPQLDAWNVGSAPHSYGSPYGNYAACHLAAGIENFQFAEWDQASTPGLDTSAYSISDGHVNVPSLPGFGLSLDEDLYAEAIRENGFVCKMS